MKKRTLKAGKFQRHYATNGILMYRERKNLIDVPEGTLVEILKARRQTHLASIRCIANPETGDLALGSGKKAVDICIAIPTDYLPKLKLDSATPAAVEVAGEVTATKSKSKAKGGKRKVKIKAVAVVVGEGQQAEQPAAEEPPAGVGPEDIQAEAPAEQTQAIVEPQAEVPIQAEAAAV